VLLHGFTGSRDSFAHLGLDAVTPDLPGHGDAPDATGWNAAVDEVAKLLDPSPVVLGGYSMGARLALAVALRNQRRIARLVLASGTAGVDDPAARRAEDEERAQRIERIGVDAFAREWEEHPTLASLKQFPQLREQRTRHRASGLASALRHLGAGAMPQLWADLPRLRVPVVLLAGKDDPKFTAIAERMHALLPVSTLHVLERCGHAPHLEQPAAFGAALRGDLA
jgi:2-succinyl-6-hydroxy-2,4-cyclohexadiene-1-carboxylate synthase